SVASAGNDHRLGANEAPPAIISMFLGEELQSIVDSIIHGEKATNGKKSKMRLGVDVLPEFPKDSTDRNRTSPFAFTGNKFEFRTPGSSFSVAGPNIVINTIVAEVLEQFSDILENAEDFNKALQELVAKTLTEHQRIIFNGNGYSAEWEAEAGKRGLLNLRNTAEALPYYNREKNVKLFEKHGVFSAREIASRMEIMQGNYVKVIVIEAKTAVEMAKKEIYPAVNSYIADLCGVASEKQSFGADVSGDKELIASLSDKNAAMYATIKELEAAIAEAEKNGSPEQGSKLCAYRVIPLMEKIREYADGMEKDTAKDYWPMPDYLDILFSVE
ncbi:MAG: glutamine synthetase type III, partial [Clostridia bacterium]|nr:glutamine synthetase type III [Clostridia bacterium]